MLDGRRTVDLTGMSVRSSRRLLAPLVACLAMALPATASAAPGAPCADANLVPTAANGAQVRAATLCLINVERTSRGRRAVRADDQLRTVAERYSADMVSHRFFAHVGYDGSTLRSRVKTGTSYLSRVAQWSLGENLYWGSDALATPAQSVDAWMHSPGHRANVLNGKFRDIGIGIAIGAPENIQGSPAATYATEFGTRRFH
jgi:uncharacterized protein YkwD